MANKGNLVILVTGEVMMKVFNKRDNSSSYEQWENDVKQELSQPFVGTTIVLPAELYADSRSNTSRMNNLFISKVLEEVNNGKNVILITENIDRVDKRLREKALIVELPNKHK